MTKKNEARLAALITKGEELTEEEKTELANLQALAEQEAAEKLPADEETKKTVSFDTEGATSVVTLRDGPKRVWFKDGKEIGVEDVG
jgi:hypothetical protein